MLKRGWEDDPGRENCMYKGFMVVAVETVCVQRSERWPVRLKFPQGGHQAEVTSCGVLQKYMSRFYFLS